MSIRPTQFNGDGSIDVWHDERQHGGVINANDIKFVRRPDDTVDHDFIILECPVAQCDSMSVHPVSGGADPEAVQSLFAHAYKRERTGPLRDVDTWDKAAKRVRERAEALDGVGRFRLEGRNEQSQPQKRG